MLKESIVCLLLFVVQIHVYCVEESQSKHKELVLYDYSSGSNFRFGNFTVSSPNKTHLGSLVYEMYMDLPNLSLQIVLLNLDGNQVIVNTTLNFCYLAKVKNRVFIVRVLTQSFLENFDFQLKCPFKKGLYQLKPRLRPLNKEPKKSIKQPFKTRFHFFPSFIKTNDTYSANYIMLSKIRGKMEYLFHSLEFYRVVEVADD